MGVEGLDEIMDDPSSSDEEVETERTVETEVGVPAEEESASSDPEMDENDSEGSTEDR